MNNKEFLINNKKKRKNKKKINLMLNFREKSYSISLIINNLLIYKVI